MKDVVTVKKIVIWIVSIGFIITLIYLSVMGIPWERARIIQKATVDANDRYAQLFNVEKVQYFVFQNKYTVYLTSLDGTVKMKTTIFASEKDENGNYEKVFQEVQ